jgi:hypothetical protein
MHGTIPDFREKIKQDERGVREGFSSLKISALLTRRIFAATVG